MSDITIPEEPPLEIDNDGSLKPTIFILNAFVNIIENPTELKEFQKEYLIDIRLLN